MTAPKLSKVERAAIRWYKAGIAAGAIRPDAHTLFVNSAGEASILLARAVAELLRARQGKKR